MRSTLDHQRLNFVNKTLNKLFQLFGANRTVSLTNYGDDMNIQMGSSGTVTINGQSFSGSNISIVNGKVVVDGKTQDMELKGIGPITVQVDGDVNQVKTGSGSVYAKNVHTIQTGSGDVECGSVGGNITTGSGDVACQDVAGSIKTGSGDVIQRIKR